MPYLSAVTLQSPTTVGNGYAAGCTAYNFSAPDQNGNQVSLYAVDGRYIILEYCTSWCPVCNTITPTIGQAVTNMLGKDYPVLHLTLLLQGRTQQSSTQLDATYWATKYSLTSPVLHMGGAQLTGSQLGTDFLNYSVAGLGGPGYPTFVFLSPLLKILRVQVGAGSLSGADALMTADEVYNLFYKDVTTNMLDATWELRMLMYSLNIDPMLLTLLDKTLGYAISALTVGNKLDASNQLKLFNKQMSDNPTLITSDKKLRLLNRSNPILKVLGYGF